MKKPLAAVIFDFDGVLVDSVEVKTTAFADLYIDYGPAIQQRVVEHHLQNKGISRLHKFRHYQTEFLGEAADEAVVNRLAERFAALVKQKVIEAAPVPGADEVLDTLHGRGIPLYVASGTPEDELIEIIDGRNMRRYFRGIHGSPRNKTDIIRGILDQGPYPAENCIMVGDAMEDYRAARNNGCEFAGVAYRADSELPPQVNLLPDMTGFIPLLTGMFRLDV